MDEKLDADAMALLSALEADELTGDERAGAEALLARSAEARATLARLERLRTLTAELPDPALPAAARRRAGDRAVAALESAVHAARRRRIALALLAGAAAAAMIAFVVARPWRARVVPVVETEIRTGAGEHRLLELGGRATAFVGERSIVRVTPGQPVRVESGRVRLVVRRDPSTPFAVATAAATAVVRGTEFDVDVTEEGTEVRVARGEVEVRNAYGARTLWAGEVARAQVGAAPRRIERVDAILLDGPAQIDPPQRRR
ncbi:MAG: FecR protein [Myxococcales bacterium]|nr:FecR protein [Myxococcales bacterium]